MPRAVRVDPPGRAAHPDDAGPDGGPERWPGGPVVLRVDLLRAAALVDEEEATLKRLRKKGASIALEAANPAYETRIFGPDRVRIQGRLVGLMRKY